IHTLFDLRLIAIESGKMVIRISPELIGTDYATLDGSLVRLPKQDSDRVSAEALDWHWSQCGWGAESGSGACRGVDMSRDNEESHNEIVSAQPEPRA
ncbi:hypothetical protein K9857_16650, partial [Pseudomonas sp. REP124]|nr:hypothetical protein [Pseudomonas sp. REP124]